MTIAQYPRAVYRALTEQERTVALRKIAAEYHLDLSKAHDAEAAHARVVQHESMVAEDADAHEQLRAQGWVDHPNDIDTESRPEAVPAKKRRRRANKEESL